MFNRKRTPEIRHNFALAPLPARAVPRLLHSFLPRFQDGVPAVEGGEWRQIMDGVNARLVRNESELQGWTEGHSRRAVANTRDLTGYLHRDIRPTDLHSAVTNAVPTAEDNRLLLSQRPNGLPEWFWLRVCIHVNQTLSGFEASLTGWSPNKSAETARMVRLVSRQLTVREGENIQPPLSLLTTVPFCDAALSDEQREELKQSGRLPRNPWQRIPLDEHYRYFFQRLHGYLAYLSNLGNSPTRRLRFEDKTHGGRHVVLTMGGSDYSVYALRYNRSIGPRSVFSTNELRGEHLMPAALDDAGKVRLEYLVEHAFVDFVGSELAGGISSSLVRDHETRMRGTKPPHGYREILPHIITFDQREGSGFIHSPVEDEERLMARILEREHETGRKVLAALTPFPYGFMLRLRHPRLCRATIGDQTVYIGGHHAPDSDKLRAFAYGHKKRFATVQLRPERTPMPLDDREGMDRAGLDENDRLGQLGEKGGRLFLAMMAAPKRGTAWHDRFADNLLALGATLNGTAHLHALEPEP